MLSLLHNTELWCLDRSGVALCDSLKWENLVIFLLLFDKARHTKTNKLGFLFIYSFYSYHLVVYQSRSEGMQSDQICSCWITDFLFVHSCVTRKREDSQAFISHLAFYICVIKANGGERVILILISLRWNPKIKRQQTLFSEETKFPQNGLGNAQRMTSYYI